MTTDLVALQQTIKDKSEFLDRITSEISKVIIGQRPMVDRLLVGLLSNGHVLLEGVPGLAKTLAVKTIARTVQASFQRIQFTPDLLPADLIGTLVFNQKEGTFTPRKGPIFANVILADEINRARTNDVGVNLTYLNYQKSVDERQAALEKQLQAGIKAGTLTEGEVKDIRAEFDKSYKLEEQMQGDGKIVWREAVQMSSALNEVEIKLYDLQRNDAGKKLKDSFVDVKHVDQREAQQRAQVQAVGGEIAVYTQQAGHHPKHQHDGQVGQYK